ncbi:MAG: carbamoyltransferase [Deltaproteobacteria bacterium]|nr:carbamoyltransferase [Deltaproteobacteria bacterium]
MSSYILGISAFYHDSAACLVRDGEIIAAAQEERFTRKKHDADFPHKAIGYCLKEAGIGIDNVDIIAFYDKPFIKLERILETYLSVAPRGWLSFLTAMPGLLKQKMWVPQIIQKELGYSGEIIFCEHHEAHAASAFYPSPFEEAAILTMDGVGEWATSSIGIGRGKDIELLYEQRFPHSLGLLYSAITYYLGFKVNSGEYKVMGLAPYGEPAYKDLILNELIDLKEDGSFRLNMKYFGFLDTLRMTNRNFDRLFGAPARKPETRLAQREMDIARSLQEATEEIMLRMARHAHKITGMKNLCLAGGVALNCVGNGRILREGPFENIWIQPAAGDAGGALGAALFGWYKYLGNDRMVSSVTPTPTHPRQGGGEERKEEESLPSLGGRGLRGGGDFMKGSYLGPSFTDDEIEEFLKSKNAPFKKVSISNIPKETARLLSDGKVIGWFQGRMEFGPRSLGARSIIGDARNREMQSTMNLKIKFRESFRPFAPSVLREDVNEWFEMDCDSPYMLLVAPTRGSKRIPLTEEQEGLFGIEKLNIPKSEIPAVTHVDYSARIQTVHRYTNPLYYDTITEFKKLTGCPVIVNTSFNVRGEPIVCTPDDAYRCFMRTNMDNLVIGSFILDKKDQPEFKEDMDWQKEFELD